MTDLIDRQAAIAIIRSLYPSMPIMPKNREWWEEKYEPFIETEKALKILPSAQPEIIHCNACKHWKQTCGEMKGFGLGECDNFGIKLVTCDGFCYWAEREKDERY